MGPCPTPTRHAPPPKVLRTPGPQKRARQIQGGLTRAEGWVHSFVFSALSLSLSVLARRVSHFRAIRISPGLGQKTCGCLLTDTRTGAGRMGRAQPQAETAQGVLHLPPVTAGCARRANAL